MNTEGYNRIWAFVRERHKVYAKRTAGEPHPWTQDPILQKFRFCNVYRELDATTFWLRQNWFAPNAGDPNLWFAAAVARHVNLPATLESLGYPVPWQPKLFLNVMRARISEGRAYSGAYLIRAGGALGLNKAEYLEQEVLTPLWSYAELRYKRGEGLAAYHARLVGQGFGLGSFMAGQIVADAKFHGDMFAAPDWWTFAAPGPGSQRGLNRVLGRPVNAPWKAADWCEENEKLRRFLDRKAAVIDMFRISGQDCQNCLCEFSKYERTRLGEGRPKQLFRSLT